MSTNRPKKGQQKSNQNGDASKAEGKGQSGRRKLEFEHKPLHGKIFYFDLIKYKNSAKLQKDITALGGKVEEFLGNGIHYVITNRPEGRELEKRGNPGGTSAESPSVSTPSPFQQGKGSSKDAADSPCALTGEKNKSSRGKAIASRALASQQFGSVSILTQAIQWGVQVKHLDSVLKYIKRERDKLGTSPAQQKSKANTERVSSSSRGDGSSGALLKVEDRNSHYRPISKSLEVWPRVSTDTAIGSCPYDGAAFKNKAQIVEQSDNGGSGNTQINNTLTKEKALTTIEIRKRKAEKMKERRRGFCECCKLRYDNLEKHLQSSQHREFISNHNHYGDLDKMITEGPDIAAFLDDVMRYHEAQKQDALSSHQEFAGTVDPKTKHMKASTSVAKTSTKNIETTLPSDLPGQSTSRLQKENSLRVSLPLEHALPKRLASQRSPEAINEADFDSSRVEEVYQEIWLGEPPLRSASEVDVSEFIKHRTAMQKRIANTSKRKVKISNNSQKKQTANVEKPLNNSQESLGDVGKTTPNRKTTSESQGNESKQIPTSFESLTKTQRKSVKRSFDEKETDHKDGSQDGSQPKEVEPKVNPRKRRKTVTEEEYEDPVFHDDIQKEPDKAGSSPSKHKQKETVESCIPKKNENRREQKSPSSHEESPAKACRGRSSNEGNDKASGSKNKESKTMKTTTNTTSGKKCQNQSKKKKDAKGLLNQVLGQNQRGKRKKGRCDILNRTYDATLSVEHIFSSDLGGSEFLGFQSEDIRESELNLQLRINESMGKAPLADAALEVTCVKCDRDANASDAQSSSQDLAIECVLHTVENFSQGESDWDVQVDGYMSKLDNDGLRPKTENAPIKVENLNTKPVVATDLSPIKSASSPIKGSPGTPNQVSRAFISEIQERRQPGYQRSPVKDLFPNMRLRRHDVLFDSSNDDIENFPVALADPIEYNENVQHQSKLKLSPSKHRKHDNKDKKIHGKGPQTPLKKLRSQSLVEPRQTICPVSPVLSVRNENIVIDDVDPVFVDSPSKHLPPGSKLRERSKSAEPRTPRTPCKTQRFMFSTPEQKDKVWLVKSPGCSASPPMLQLPAGTPQEEVKIIEENYVHDETEIEIAFPKLSSPMTEGIIKTPVKHIADPQTGRPVPSPVKSMPNLDTALSSVMSINKALFLSPIKMNVAVYVPDFAKEGFTRNLFGSKKSSSAKSRRSPSTTSSAVISPKNSFMLFYDKHSSTPTSATFRARTKVISPIFSAYKKPRFSLNLLKPPKMKYAKSGRRTRKQMKEEQEDLLRRLSLSQFINKNNTESHSDDLNESLDAIYDFEEDDDKTSSDSSTSKRRCVKRKIKKSTETSECSSKKKSTNKKIKDVPQSSSRRRTRSNGKRSSVSSLQELMPSPGMMKELFRDGFFC